MTTMCKDLAILPARATELARSQKGSVIIEFALILPLFLILLFGMVTFSTALYNKTVLTMASREGARAGVVFVANQTEADIRNRASSVALQVCQDNLISFGPSMTPSVTPVISGDTLTVTASGNYSGVFIFSDMAISAETSMRIE